ncbi:GNAT family N-acetyltransferase [Micromonospora sp. WMMD975]|uniref:GNAT family N-acetyltransferase n=1 Tax=Micromonospora sp. WMMD975 TaxID=3016087 RepID=UPI00249C9F85|nr:GNAT family N-acetyltransferase [Micromonospora sp. WMMD975]WFE34429.1 GNAT family N-acetyltransferase [Micromonospora sp. WMMD975]
MDVREATPADLDDIVDLHTRARIAYYGAGGVPAEEIVNPELAREQRDGWTAAIVSPHKHVWCAVMDGRLVGLLAMGPPHSSEVDAAQLYQIHVDPDSWGRGIGSTLHGLFLRHLKAEALSVGVLEVWERNARARAFYARHGWQPDGTSRPGPAGAPYLGMRRSLP